MALKVAQLAIDTEPADFNTVADKLIGVWKTVLAAKTPTENAVSKAIDVLDALSGIIYVENAAERSLLKRMFVNLRDELMILAKELSQPALAAKHLKDIRAKVFRPIIVMLKRHRKAHELFVIPIEE